jgi:hypothetical protein
MEPVQPVIERPRPVLAPFTPGRLVLRTFGIWFHHAIPFTLVTLLVQLPVAVLQLRAGLMDDMDRFALLALFSWLLGVVASGALCFGVLESLAGRRPAAGAMLATSARRLWPIFTAALLYGLTVVLGLFLLVVPGILALVAGFLATPVVLAEPALGPEGALRRSWTLTDGHRRSLFAAVAFLFGLQLAATLGLSALAEGPGAPSLPAVIAIDTVLSAILGGLTSCCAAVAFHDLRQLKDGRPRAAVSLQA